MSVLRQRSFSILSLRCVVALLIASVSHVGMLMADTIVLQVDSAQSSLTLSGQAFFLAYEEQAAQSLVANWGGSITADLTGGVLTFSGGSSIEAQVNPVGPFTTAPNPAGDIQGNYGCFGFGAVFGFGIVTVNGVYRDLILDISAGTTQNGSPLTAGNLVFTQGELIWGAANNLGQEATGSSDLANVSGTNTSVSAASWDGTTLVLPVSFQTPGSNRVELWQGTIVASVVASAPTLMDARVHHFGYSGAGSAINNSTDLIVRSEVSQEVELTNLINSNRGLNGISIDVEDLADLDDLSFEYQMSPQGAYNEGDHPVSGWVNAPAPVSTTLLAGQGLSGSDRILIQWADNAIENRYLRISAVYSGNTLFEVYGGHLLGETTGASGGSFTISFSDITPIRNAVGQSVDASSAVDINKDGTISFADISAMRGNVGSQLTQITIPPNP